MPMENLFCAAAVGIQRFCFICQPGYHRLVGVGRDLCGSPSPTPCPSRVTQSRLHSTASRRGLNISREGDSTASLGSLGQGSVTLRGKNHGIIGWKRPLRSSSPTIKKFFHQAVLPHVQLELPRLQFVPVAPCPVAGHHWKESGPVLLPPTLCCPCAQFGVDAPTRVNADGLKAPATRGGRPGGRAAPCEGGGWCWAACPGVFAPLLSTAARGSASG